MPRPTIDHLLDSEIRLWRRVSDTGNALATEESLYVPIAVVKAKLNRSKTAERDIGGGLKPVGTLRWYGRPDIDVRARDVCEVIAGPDAGLTWEVDGEPNRPKAHHTQVDCVEWHGVLESLEPQS